MSTLTYFYIASLALATLAGIIKFRKDFPIHLKVIILLLPYVLLVEISVVFFRNLIKDNNVLPQYNVVMLIEFLIYAYFFKTIIVSAFLKKAISIFMILFPVFWYISVFFIFKITEWNSYIFLVGGTFTIIWALVYCYQLLTSIENVRLNSCSEFWIALGIIIFYSSQVPFMGIYNFLIVNYPSLIMNFQIGLQVTNIIMYSLFTYAFLCKKTIIMKYS
ncbi:hypothetical protein [Pedobacter alluvionis]|uniref:Uncharacterized protein n=1 Tax=Pedobacter alluvionis TaxID=475253 RepID=A0A497YGZ1_9SPHI|nr:hypothetical protein [Pedobacter alluvionis]RLJ80579.1 hypothetical protein BCL90_1363 [Pedobacter alluvionis]TFB31845.1 hypothetical protein E3V97_14805 [Pedobacter alluvionis]